MDLRRIKKSLGRTPNPEEVTFLNNLFLVCKPLLKWRNELAIIESGRNKYSAMILLAGQNPSDPLKTDGLLSCIAGGYDKRLTLKINLGTIIGGERLFQPKTDINVTDGTLLFVQKSRSLLQFVKSIYSRSEVMSLEPVFKNGLPLSILKLVSRDQSTTGICLNGFQGQDEFFNHRKAGILTVVQGGFDQELIQQGEETGCSVFSLGHLTEDGMVSFELDGIKKVRIHKSIITTLLGNQNADTAYREIKTAPVSQTHSKVKIKDYSAAIQNLVHLTQSRENPVVAPAKLLIESQVVFGNLRSGKGFGIALNDNDHLEISDPGIRGMAFLSSAVRRLVCRGIKPESATALILSNKRSNKLTELIQGLKKAADHLNIQMSNSVVATKKQDGIQCRVAAAGLFIKQKRFPQHFQRSGDFISILGSHRGELGTSLFLKHLSTSNHGVHPTLDLNMESRIQEAVLTGIQAGLIQSARSVSGGGLAVTIAKALLNQNSAIGARIHYSRKLSPEELLFGETQGLTLISITEDDLMEFERICMNIGVPSTTIGRVTADGLYTFNDIVKLAVKDLHSK